MLDVARLRSQFPALKRPINGQPVIYFDGPAGTQVPMQVIEAITSYLRECNANHGGFFATSRQSDQVVHRAHEAMADLLNAREPDEIIFGANMTTLTLHLSRAIGKTLRPGDEVVVTRLDHDANVTPWILAARDAGAQVRTVDVHPEDCTLDLDDLRRQVGSRTRLLAMACASNAVGTVNDIATACRVARAAGALVFLDAVHYAPHGPIDVQAWDCDFLACSAYKFFGPHVGVLWGKRELLETLPAYKLRPVPESLPDRWMTGTQNHECLAGVAAAVDYLAQADLDVAEPAREPTALPGSRQAIRNSLAAIKGYEASLSSTLLEGLGRRPWIRVWGIKDLARVDERVPTVSISMDSRTAHQIAEHLAGRNINVWSGNMYAIGLSERVGLEGKGGFLRIGLVHYNTVEEISRFLIALDELKP
jgi:cysteine desulfurase family protein (TIGR01976 family)